MLVQAHAVDGTHDGTVTRLPLPCAVLGLRIITDQASVTTVPAVNCGVTPLPVTMLGLIEPL